MESSRQQAAQTAQRVKVGVTGLAVVLLMILLATAVLRSVGRDRAPAAGAPRAELAANLSAGNVADAGEPLAEIGAAPSDAGNTAAAARGR